jgi:hypothetical protein
VSPREESNLPLIEPFVRVGASYERVWSPLVEIRHVTLMFREPSSGHRISRRPRLTLAATATIRVAPETRDRLDRIGAVRGPSAGELLDELASQAEDRRCSTRPASETTGSTSTATRRSAPSSTATGSNEHPRQRPPLQPAGHPDSPQLGRRRRVDCRDHRPGPRTGNRTEPPPPRLRARHPRSPGSRQLRRRRRARPRDRQTPPRTSTRRRDHPQRTERRRGHQPPTPTSIGRQPALGFSRTSVRPRADRRRSARIGRVQARIAALGHTPRFAGVCPAGAAGGKPAAGGDPYESRKSAPLRWSLGMFACVAPRRVLGVSCAQRWLQASCSASS